MRQYRRVFAIGDVHGHFDALSSLMAVLHAKGADLEDDLFVQLGDMVDRGPNSRAVVEYFHTKTRVFPENVVVLKGNHEQMMLDALDGIDRFETFQTWWFQGGMETYESYLPPDSLKAPTRDRIPDAFDREHIEWIRSLPTHFETDRAIFVHAGLPPHLSPEQAHDNEKLWIREEFTASMYDWGKPVIFGHTPLSEPLDLPNKVGIDTILKCGYLTAVELHADGRRTFYRSTDPIK